MFLEFFKALLMAGLPVGVTSYLLIWWALRKEYFEHTFELKRLEDEVQQLAKSRSRRKKGDNDEREDAVKPKLSPVHNKWLAFGGGFYGVVALMTFGIVELSEIRDFFADFGENVGKLSKLDAGMVINFFVESVMNFVTAIAWPAYWMGEIRSGQFWIWFLAAYAGYWLGAKVAIAGKGPLDRQA